MLVVADEVPVRIARQRGLAGSRETEEQRDITPRADVRRAVHRQHVAQRQQIVHDGEDRLLDLPRVARPADEDELLRKIQQDEDLGVGAVGGGIRVKARHVDDGEVRRVRGAVDDVR